MKERKRKCLQVCFGRIVKQNKKLD